MDITFGRNFEYHFGIFFGRHFETSLFDIPFSRQFLTSLLVVTCWHNLWTSLLDNTFGHHFWTSLFDVTFWCTIFTSLGNITVVRQYWICLLYVTFVWRVGHSFVCHFLTSLLEIFYVTFVHNFFCTSPSNITFVHHFFHINIGHNFLSLW